MKNFFSFKFMIYFLKRYFNIIILYDYCILIKIIFKDFYEYLYWFIILVSDVVFGFCFFVVCIIMIFKKRDY